MQFSFPRLFFYLVSCSTKRENGYNRSRWLTDAILKMIGQRCERFSLSFFLFSSFFLHSTIRSFVRSFLRSFARLTSTAALSIVVVADGNRLSRFRYDVRALRARTKLWYFQWQHGNYHTESLYSCTIHV